MEKVLLVWALITSINLGYSASHVTDDMRPNEHCCPITLAVMVDPVMAADGYSYERAAIVEHFDMCTRLSKPFTSPKTNLPLEHHYLTTNQALKTLIQDWTPTQPMVVSFSSVGGDETRQRQQIEREETLAIKQLKELIVQNHQNLLQHHPIAVQANPVMDKTTSRSVDRPMSLAIPDIARGYEDEYRLFLSGVLVYKKGQSGEVKLPVAALSNPLEGVFDLSRCGDTGNYLSIRTGYRKQKIQYPQVGYRTTRVEIWLCPRFLIERELATSAGCFQPIMDAWDTAKAPIGIFWTGSQDVLGACRHLTTHAPHELTTANLYAKYTSSLPSSPPPCHVHLMSPEDSLVRQSMFRPLNYFTLFMLHF